MITDKNHFVIRFTLVLLVFFFGCNVPTYNETSKKSYQFFLNKDYDNAIVALDKNKYLKQKHSKILYLIEKGRLQLLAKHYDVAFQNLNEADLALDAWRELKERDVVGSIQTLKKTETRFGVMESSTNFQPLNEWFKKPTKLPYRPNHYERILIHYYKAICLIQMNKLDEAEVEAKQLNLLSQNIDDLQNAEPDVKKYVSDALPQLLAGIIYELQLDDNSAFIEYENAYRKLNEPENYLVYGVKNGEQLKRDLLRLSRRLDFDDRVQQYEQLFVAKSSIDTIKAYAVILIDNGVIPFKTEDYSWYHMKYGILYRGMDGKKNSLLFSSPVFTKSQVNVDEVVSIHSSKIIHPEQIYNPFYLTMNTLNNRYRKQTDVYIKSMFRADTVINNTKQYRRCDTRNWQTLPQSIQYVKVPLDTGWNQLLVAHQSGKMDTLNMRAVRRNNFYYLAN